MAQPVLPRQKRKTSSKDAAFERKHLPETLHAWERQYNAPSFIAGDPVSFPHRYRNNPVEAELVAFIAAMFSYGSRRKILETVDNILERMQPGPLAFVENFQMARDTKVFRDFYYRFNRGSDLAFLCERLSHVYREFGSLEKFFLASGLPVEDTPLQEQLASFVDRLSGSAGPLPSYGLKFLFAHPARGGACKRLNMFLRWMVRQDGEPSVDLGLWQKSLKASQLIVPLDIHVATVGRNLGLTRRKANDWQTAEEITAYCRTLSPEDPVKYDFALFGYGENLKPARRQG